MMTVMTAVPPDEPNQMSARTIQPMGGTPSRTVTTGFIKRMAAKE